MPNISQKKFPKHYFIFFIVIFSLISVIFLPLFIKNQIPFPSNFLASFFSPFSFIKFPGWEQGISYKHVGMDDLRLYFPWRAFTDLSIQKFNQIPFWNPYNFSGNFHAGLSETSVFYPLSLLFFILPQIDAWTVLLIIAPIITGLGMFIYLKLLVKNKLIAIYGGVAWAISGLVITRLVDGLNVGHTLVWLPFVFAGIVGYRQSGKIRYLWMQLGGLVMSLLSGWFQYTFYIYLFSLIYTVFVFLKNNPQKPYLKNPTTFIFLPFIFLPIVTLFQLVLSVEALSQSPRWLQNDASSLLGHLMPVRHLLTLFFQDIFGNPASSNFFGKSVYKESMVSVGIIPLFLSVYAVMAIFKNRTVKFFSFSILIAIILSINNPISQWVVQSGLPIISSFLPNRVLMVASFSIVVLSAFGLVQLSEKSKSVKIKQFLPFILLYLFTFSVFGILYVSGLSSPVFMEITRHLIGSDNFSVINIAFRNTLLPLGISTVLLFAVFIFRKKSTLIIISVLFLTLIQGIYGARKYISISERQFVYPETPLTSYLKNYLKNDRFITLGSGSIWTNIPLVYGLPSPEGIAAMYPQRYGELFTYATGGENNITPVPRVEVQLSPNTETILDDKNMKISRFLDLTGVKYFAVLNQDLNIYTPVTFPNGAFSKVYTDDTWSVIKNNLAFPRWFFTGEFLVETDKLKILNNLFSPDYDYRQLIIERDPGFTSRKNIRGNVSLVSYKPNSILFNVIAASNGLLYISDNHTPNFKAKVDNKPVPLLRANYTFRAVPVPAGQHDVLVYYDSGKFKAAFILSSLTLLFLCFLSLKIVRNKVLKW